MTHFQYHTVSQLNGVTFIPGTRAKSFARSMGRKAESDALTPKQWRYVLLLVVRFRRQLPNDLVSVARDLLDAMDGKPVQKALPLVDDSLQATLF